MSDDERVSKLQTDVIAVVNECGLPLSVKALVLENTLLRVQAAITQTAAIKQNTQTEKREAKQE